jgi:hypothetical protein
VFGPDAVALKFEQFLNLQSPSEYQTFETWGANCLAATKTHLGGHQKMNVGPDERHGAGL